MASEIRVNQIQNRSGLTTTTFTDTGVTIAGILTVSQNLNVGGVLTYEDVTNIDSIGIVTARAGINLVGNDLNVGSNIKIGNASGIVTATSFVGSGANLTGITQTTINTNADNRIITGSGTANTLNGEATLTYDGNQLNVVQTTSSSDSKVVVANSNTPGSGALRLEFQYGTGTTEGTNRFRFGYVEGYRQSGSNDGGLIFGTKPSNAGAPTERLRIDSSGKIGVGGAPSGWQAATTSKVIQIGNASIFNYNDAYFHVGQNFYYDGSNYKYVANGFSSRLIQNAGEFTFIQAASGSANANITWSDRLKIDTTGRITQNGTTSADTASALTLKNGVTGNDHTILELISDPNQTSRIYFGASDDRYKGQIYYKDNDHYMMFRTNGTDRMRISSAGYVTKSAHPSFCARFQSGDGYASTNIFRLTGINNDNFTWNTGGHYSTSTGKFTAPVAGVYFFEGQAMTTGHSNGDNIQDMMELRTNNGLVTYCRQRRTYFRSDADANGYYVNGTSGQVNLAVGDTVWFQRRSGLGYSYGNSHYTYFTGWLIG